MFTEIFTTYRQGLIDIVKSGCSCITGLAAKWHDNPFFIYSQI